MELCLWEVIEIKGKQGSKYTTNDKGRNCIFETSEAIKTTILKISPRNNHFVKSSFKYLWKIIKIKNQNIQQTINGGMIWSRITQQKWKKFNLNFWAFSAVYFHVCLDSLTCFESFSSIFQAFFKLVGQVLLKYVFKSQVTPISNCVTL